MQPIFIDSNDPNNLGERFMKYLKKRKAKM